MDVTLFESPGQTACGARREAELSALVEKLLGEVAQLRSEVAVLHQQVAGGTGSRTGVATPQEVKLGYSVVNNSSRVHHARITSPSLFPSNLPGLRPGGAMTDTPPPGSSRWSDD